MAENKREVSLLEKNFQPKRIKAISLNKKTKPNCCIFLTLWFVGKEINAIAFV